MKKRNPKPRISRRPIQDFDPGPCECVTSLPPSPTGKHKRTLARLVTLVAKASGRTQGALERGEALVALHDAHLATLRATKRAPARRVR